MPGVPPRKPPSAKEVFVALKTAASSGRLFVSDREECLDGLDRLEYAIEDVSELVKKCRLTDLRKSEPDDNPDRSDQWTALLRVEDEDGKSLYVKFSLPLPTLGVARLISFKEWR